MKIKLSDNQKKLLASIAAGLLGNLLAYLSSLLTPMQPQVTFDFSHIATFAVAVAFGPFYGLLTGAIGAIYPYYEFAVLGIYGPWYGLAIIFGKAMTGYFCGLLRNRLPTFLAVTVSYIPECIYTQLFLLSMSFALPAGAMTWAIATTILMEGWVEVIIFSFIIEMVVRRRIMETAVLMLEIFIIMLLVHKEFILSLLLLLLITFIVMVLFEMLKPLFKDRHPGHPPDSDDSI
ncbi:MAG: hypothetical protein NTV42_08910 [Chloroflexi bacterium]|nr:hypothetical protein [Chloroflexota bacterium]